MERALQDIAENAERPSVSCMEESEVGVYYYHLKHSKRSGRSASNRVRDPRHFVVFRLPSDMEVLVLRILHERMQSDPLELKHIT